MPIAMEPPDTGELSTITFPTKLGWMAIEFDAEVVTRIKFGYRSQTAMLREARLADLRITDRGPAAICQLREQLKRFAAGGHETFGDVALHTRHLTPFAARITAECRAIARGEVMTYAQLATRAGRPGAARAVGNVMASNRFPLVVPCHRVVGSGGSLGGYSAPGGLDTKRHLLAMEQTA